MSCTQIIHTVPIVQIRTDFLLIWKLIRGRPTLVCSLPLFVNHNYKMLTDSYTSLWSPFFPDNLLFHRSVIGSCSILQTDGTTLPISMLANLVNVEMTFSPALVLHRKICDWDLSSWNYTQLCKQLCKPKAQCCVFLQYQKFTCTHKIISATY